MMGKKTRKILDTVEKILKQQEKMMKANQGEQSQQMAQIAETLTQQQARMEQMSKAVSQHDLALTDLIDSWEEIQEAQQERMDQLQSERDDTLRMEMESAAKREMNLLSLQIETMDHLFLLEKAMKDLPGWQEQLRMIQQQLKVRQQMAGLDVISDTEVIVNYDIHEVTEVRETEDQSRNAVIAEIYQPGYLYQGAVIRKAKAAAWKYQEKAEAN